MKIKPIAVSDLVRQLNLQFIGSDFTITDLCSILSLRPYALTFSNKPQVLMKLSFPLAIISQNKPDSAVTWIQSDNPIYDFVRACKILLVEEKPLCGENYAAFIHPTVKFNPAVV
ncbi:MAG: hypothetical protein NZO16_04905, partial [Deltaproteobacteria bacterium]|nr:hypothetical protein [Deltaproteobacteria bacterium]